MGPGAKSVPETSRRLALNNGNRPCITMWTCTNCKENIEDQFDSCWKCGTRRDGAATAQPPRPATTDPSPPGSTGGHGAAFVKGGCGCLVFFVALALLAVLMGGHAHADLGGLIILFIIGGVIGLIAFAIYNKGRRDATGGQPPSNDGQNSPRPPGV